jgi:hypothetical protein
MDGSALGTGLAYVWRSDFSFPSPLPLFPLTLPLKTSAGGDPRIHLLCLLMPVAEDRVKEQRLVSR